MNPKLNKVNAEIEKMEARLVETQASLKDLRAEKKQLEDLEIVKTIRAMKSTDMDVMELIKMMQEGRASVPAFSVAEEKPQMSASVYKKESEDDENE
jgi:septal ring factor EnvC (AmiA/AmiB activator)